LNDFLGKIQFTLFKIPRKIDEKKFVRAADDINSLTGNILKSYSKKEISNKNGTINIELWLSPDLQARVMDSTLDQVANIMLDIQRRR